MTDRQGDGPSAAHWRRFRRLMLLMLVLGVGSAAAAVAWALHDGVPFHLHFVLAMGGGIILSLLLAGALMGLVFLSNASGHDAAVSQPDEEA